MAASTGIVARKGSKTRRSDSCQSLFEKVPELAKFCRWPNSAVGLAAYPSPEAAIPRTMAELVRDRRELQSVDAAKSRPLAAMV
jgi:hypothetical protein